MAHRLLSSLSSAAKFKSPRPSLHFTISSYPLSTNPRTNPTLTTPTSLNPNTTYANLDEPRILASLSRLFPIPFRPSNQRPPTAPPPVDNFLSPEEKLRGVFLQKLKGKFAIEQALTRTRVNLSIDVVDKVLRNGNLDGDSMVTFFNWCIKQNGIDKCIFSYNILIRALGRRKFIDFMLNVLRDLRSEGMEADIETLEIVVDSLVRARGVNRVTHMVGEEFKFHTECLNVVLKCLCRRGHVGAANKYLNSVNGKVAFDLGTYNIVLNGWSRFGQVEEIERTLKSMVDDGFSADCSTYGYVIEGLGRAGMIGEAVKVFDSMKEKSCEPDISVYNAMIFNFVSVGDFDECMKWYRCLLSSNCDPNLETYAKMITAFIKARKVADALELFDEMLAQGSIPTTGTVTSFIEPLCSFGPPHAALMFYKRAIKVGCKISLKAYKLLLMRLSRFGKCGMLLGVWEEMQQSGYSTDIEVYEYIVSGLCHIGQLENAVLVLEECLQKGFCPSRLIYSKLNNKLLAANKVERAYRLFLKIKSARANENARRFWRANGWHF